MDMSQDQNLDPNQLPIGHTPIWIKATENTSNIKMFEKVLMLPELEQYNNNVTVLSANEDMDAEVMEECDKLGWKYFNYTNFTGVEDQVIILLNTNLLPETITRAINLLIIVADNYFRFLVFLNQDYEIGKIIINNFIILVQLFSGLLIMIIQHVVRCCLNQRSL